MFTDWTELINFPSHTDDSFWIISLINSEAVRWVYDSLDTRNAEIRINSHFGCVHLPFFQIKQFAHFILSNHQFLGPFTFSIRCFFVSQNIKKEEEQNAWIKCHLWNYHTNHTRALCIDENLSYKLAVILRRQLCSAYAFRLYERRTNIDITIQSKPFGV